MNPVEELKKLFATLGVVLTFIQSVVIAGLTILLPQLTPSETFQFWIRWMVLVGALLGVYITFARFAGNGRDKCLRGVSRHLMLGVLLFALMILTITITEAKLVEHATWLKSTREFLNDVPELTNPLVGAMAGFGAYFALGALVLAFPAVWKAKLD